MLHGRDENACASTMITGNEEAETKLRHAENFRCNAGKGAATIDGKSDVDGGWSLSPENLEPLAAECFCEGFSSPDFQDVCR